MFSSPILRGYFCFVYHSVLQLFFIIIKGKFMLFLHYTFKITKKLPLYHEIRMFFKATIYIRAHSLNQ